MSKRSLLSRIVALGVVPLLDQPSWAKPLSVPTKKWNFGVTTPHWQPLEVATGDTLVISVKVAGQPVHAILDSGSGMTVISAKLAHKLGLEKSQRRTVGGLSSKVSVEFVSDVDVTLADETSRLPHVMIADLNDASAGFGRPIDVLIGADLFATSAIALDFVGRRFAVTKSGSFKTGAGWASIKLEQGIKKDLFIRASISGLAPIPLMLDLGSATALMIAEAFVQQHGLMDGKARSTAAVGGVDGVKINDVFTIPVVTIGESEVTDVPAMSMKEWLPTSTAGNIGLPIIAQFDVVFDLGAGFVYLRPIDAPHRLPMLKDRSGLGLAASPTGLTVVHVAPNSPAQKNGWIVGERIVAVNGQPIDENYTHGNLWRWRFSSAGTLTKLELAGSALRLLQLADYY